MDTHALSEPALTTASRCWPPTAWRSCIQAGLGYTPTPVISHAILTYNRGPRSRRWPTASSSRPPTTRPRTAASSTTRPTAGRPTPTITAWIEERANALLAAGLRGVRRMPYERALPRGDHALPRLRHPLRGRSGQRRRHGGHRAPPGSKIGVDPMGGAGVAYWEPIAERYGLDLEVVNPTVDPTFSLHDRGPGRQDPHGLLLALRHGQPDRAEGPLRHRLRQRPRLPTATASSPAAPG